MSHPQSFEKLNDAQVKSLIDMLNQQADKNA